MSATLYLNKFLDAKLAAGRVESTLRFYRDTLGQFVSIIGHWPPTPDDLRRYFIYKRKTCNETSICTAFTAIRSFLNWCKREGLLDDNPIYRIDRPMRAKTLPAQVGPAQVGPAQGRMRGINLDLFDVVEFIGDIPGDIDRDKKYILNDADPENATIEDNPAWEGDE